MPLALRIRVTWDDDIVQDEIFFPPRTVCLGASGRPHVITPAGTGETPITFAWRGTHYLLSVPPQDPETAATILQLAGAASLSDPAPIPIGPQGVTRRLTHEAGHIQAGPAAIDFEILPLEREAPPSRLLRPLKSYAQLLILLLALAAGLSYPLLQGIGDGIHPRRGEVKPIGTEQASRLRVHLAPAPRRTSKLATGQGQSLHGQVVPAPRPPAHTPPIPPRPVAALAAGKSPASLPAPGPAEEQKKLIAPTAPHASHQTLLERGQQAFLAAELRTAIDSLNAAEKRAPLDYDNLIWLGLAHYFLGELDPAAARWNQALALDGQRAEAINNLGGIARRRGDLAGEASAYERALDLHPGDCHALNSLALARAKQGHIDLALSTLAESDQACGGDYAYTYIQRAGILALAGKLPEARAALAQGLPRIDTLVPIKEYEVAADLYLDPAFTALRDDPDFVLLTEKYLPRTDRAQILAAAPQPLPAQPQPSR
ncbi:MAG TPA: hypothetical protein VH877_32290 [Polyangia bacterium]|jgi:tetratricopeptide (TPR) repeat protein|nr:hypothetical protein [Polyangia bacterium]